MNPRKRFCPTLFTPLFLILFIFSFYSLSKPSTTCAGISINEVLAHPVTGEKDWIELYKDEELQVSLSGWTINDSTGILKTFSDEDLFASSSSFLIIYVSNRLNNNGDVIRLTNESGVIVDEVSYASDPGVAITLGKYPDGADSFGQLSQATVNMTNASYAPLKTPTVMPTATITLTAVKNPTATSNVKAINTRVATSYPTLTIAKVTISVSTLAAKIKEASASPIEDLENKLVVQGVSTQSSPAATKLSKLFSLPLLFFLIGSLFIALSLFLYIKKGNQ